jgi:pimeloyl-ACP methyl ester carboxylesterase
MVIAAINNIAQFGTQIVETVKNNSFVQQITSLASACLELKRNAEALVETAQTARKYVAFVAHEAPTLLERLQRSEGASKEVVQKLLELAPTEEAYFQILAQNASYKKWEKNDVLNPSLQYAGTAFRVHETFHFPHGISGAVLVAAGKPPIIALRGTDPTNYRNLLDDLHENIGTFNCTHYEKELLELLQRTMQEHGRIHIMGHSYGGTVAARLTASYPHLVTRCTTYNAPGVGDAVVKQYRENVQKLPENVAAPTISSYRHAKDIVSLLGGAHLPASPGCELTAGTAHDQTPLVEAHSLNSLSGGVQHFVGCLAARELREWATSIEGVRRRALRESMK